MLQGSRRILNASHLCLGVGAKSRPLPGVARDPDGARGETALNAFRELLPYQDTLLAHSARVSGRMP